MAKYTNNAKTLKALHDAQTGVVRVIDGASYTMLDGFTQADRMGYRYWGWLDAAGAAVQLPQAIKLGLASKPAIISVARRPNSRGTTTWYVSFDGRVPGDSAGHSSAQSAHDAAWAVVNRDPQFKKPSQVMRRFLAKQPSTLNLNAI